MFVDTGLEVKADPFSLESLISWLEKKPADQGYVWTDCSGGCLLDQYADAVGMPPSVTRYSKLDKAFEDGLLIAFSHPRTFGAALQRARAALAQQ